MDVDTSDPIITLTPGDGMQTLQVHSSLLFKHSKFFQNATKREWTNGVKVLTDWLYSKNIDINLYKSGGDTREKRAEEAENVFITLAEAHAFGEKYLAVGFKNAVMHTIFEAIKSSSWNLGPGDVKIIYDGTPLNSPLWHMNPSILGNEAPPAYTPGLTKNVGAVRTISMITPSDSNPYVFLRSFDTIFLVDDSGSMAGRSWRETQEALAAITPICTAHDEDGIDLYFLNHSDSGLYKEITRPSTIIEIFQAFFQVGWEPGAREHLKQLDEGLAELAQNSHLRDIVDTVPFSDAEGGQLTAKCILKVIMGAINRKSDRNSKDLHRNLVTTNAF
ncbi:hypothetical protein J3E71DRAFT_348035 [Bipolaris maydis]|nr:hypothetical protein J3E71DRAFT_348035 [Bipolaris maydis]